MTSISTPIPHAAVVTTRNRPDVLFDCIQSIHKQVRLIVVVDNGDDASAASITEDFAGIQYYADPQQPVNLSQLWNVGLELVQFNFEKHFGHWNVAVLNDDAIVPPGWFDAVGAAMRQAGAAAGCSDPNNSLRESMLLTEPGPVGLAVRMVGWAHMLAGEKGLRYDEDLHWWFGDDDMDWQSRAAGGMIMIPGYPVENRFPNGHMSAERHERAGLDREAFARKWNGLTPW